jgi:N-acetylmuramoyl-L-alanine amidase
MTSKDKGECMMLRVAIDPGHCSYGEDTGAEGNGLREQDLTLDISLKLRDILVGRNFDVMLTREGDLVKGLQKGYTLHESLQRRCDIANAFQANIFISIHINSVEITSPSGVEILVAGFGGEAQKLAEKILPYLVGLGQKNRHVKTQNVYVLQDGHTAMPAILTENGFISNVQDAERLANPAFRQKIAIAHADGIIEYFGQGGSDMLKIAILKFTPEDEWAAKDVDAKHGGIANFTRYGTGKIVPAEALQADQLIVIGGPTTGHKNEILLSGKDKYETAAKVALYLAK